MSERFHEITFSFSEIAQLLLVYVRKHVNCCVYPLIPFLGYVLVLNETFCCVEYIKFGNIHFFIEFKIELSETHRKTNTYIYI